MDACIEPESESYFNNVVNDGIYEIENVRTLEYTTMNNVIASSNNDRNNSLGAQREQNLPPDLLTPPVYHNFTYPNFRLARESIRPNQTPLLSRRRQLDILRRRPMTNSSLRQMYSDTAALLDNNAPQSLFRPSLLSNGTFNERRRGIIQGDNISDLLLNFNESRNMTTGLSQNEETSNGDSSSSYSISVQESDINGQEKVSLNYNTNLLVFQDYANFRDYPLNMSFADTQNEDALLKSIYSSYGHFAVALYNISTKNKMNIPTLFVSKSEDWIKLFFKYVNNLIKKTYSSSTAMKPNGSYKEELMSKTYYILLDCFNALPNLEHIRNIVWKKQYSVKESLPIKLTLDLLESFFANFSSDFENCSSKDLCEEQESSSFYKQNYRDMLDKAIEIYGLFSEEDIREIYSNLYKFNLKTPRFRTKEDYIGYYKGLKRKFVELNEGLKKSLFVV